MCSEIGSEREKRWVFEDESEEGDAFRGFDVWVGYDAAERVRSEIGFSGEQMRRLWMELGYVRLVVFRVLRKLCRVIVASSAFLDLSFFSVRRSWSFGPARSKVARCSIF